MLALYRLCKSTLVGSILQLPLYTNRNGAEGFHLSLRPGGVKPTRSPRRTFAQAASLGATQPPTQRPTKKKSPSDLRRDRQRCPQKPGASVNAPGSPGAKVNASQAPGANINAPGSPGASVNAPGSPGASVNTPGSPGASVNAPLSPGAIGYASGPPGAKVYAPGVIQVPGQPQGDAPAPAEPGKRRWDPWRTRDPSPRQATKRCPGPCRRFGTCRDCRHPPALYNCTWNRFVVWSSANSFVLFSVASYSKLN